MNLAYLVQPDQNAAEIDDPRLSRISLKDHNKRLLEVGKAAVKQKFNKLAEIIDKHDAVFRGEDNGLKLKTPTDQEQKPKAEVDKLMSGSVIVHALKGIHVPKSDNWDTWDIDNELRIDH